MEIRKDANKDVKKEVRKAPPKEVGKAPFKVEKKEPPKEVKKEPLKVVNKEPSKEVKKEIPKDVKKEPSKDGKKVTLKMVKKDAVKGVKKAPPKKAVQVPLKAVKKAPFRFFKKEPPKENKAEIARKKMLELRNQVRKPFKQSNHGLAYWVLLGVLVAATVTIFFLSAEIFGDDSVFNNDVSRNTTINTAFKKIPSFLSSIRIITIAWIVSVSSRWLLDRVWAKNNRSKTIVKLISNFIKYLVVVIAAFLVLGVWGVNPTALLASAGILSLIIGLGAQSLISDIIAGMFIVFEDEFRVGDIVIIDGWRGTVDEIGIRSTKVIDWQGNIKIINNSGIATIINQSKELSVTTCVISIGYDESIPRVELIIKNNIERIRAAIPEIVEGPYYKGVDSLSESCINLLFVATVLESDYYVVQRALNRELKMLFDENDISIPFPQVTVSYATQGDSSFDKYEKRRADKFAAEQREVSKRLEDVNP